MYLNINLFVCAIFLGLVSADSQSVFKRFEYKYSFKPPYLAQVDGTVPFFEYGGNAIASGDGVRLAPSMRSQKGAIWSKSPVTFDWWEVDIMFKVTGRGRIGADGLAFWYTAAKGDYTGEVFGSSDRWRGLGVMFDSFDNDNKHNNPYIMAVLNDGDQSFDHKSDGSAQLLSGCLRDFRNKPFPVRARIEYYLNTLTVYFHNGMTNNPNDYELCFRAENVVLPRGGYLGLSAATGGLADDHDVVHLLTSSLHGTQQPTGQQISSDEQQKLSREYQQYQTKLDQQKEDYRKEHPDEARDKDGDVDDWFESDGQRELRQIFQGQGQIFDVLRDLNKKVDEVIGKQMNSLSLLSAVYSAAQGQPPAANQPPGQPPASHQPPHVPLPRDLEPLLASNQLIVNTIAELKGFIIEISRKSDSLLGVSGSNPSVAAVQLQNEMKENIQQVKQAVLGIAQRLSAPGSPAASPQAACPAGVSVTSLLVVAALQLALMLAYTMYRERKEAQAKKFF